MKLSDRNKGVDLMAGSEKILRVHHRNMVHARYLQHSLNNLDSVCKRNLNRVQQEIYNVYYSEYLPLRESKRKIEDNNQRPNVRKGTKRFDFASDGKVKQKCILPELSSDRSTYGSISTMSTTTRFSAGGVVLPSIFEKHRKRNIPDGKSVRQPKFIPLSSFLKLPKEERCQLVGKWKQDFERACPSVVSRSEQNGSPNIESDRLKIIKSAIALSSQPPPDIENSKKNRKLRKSFLVSLRRQSNAAWNNSVSKVTRENGFLNKIRSSNAKQSSALSASRLNSAKSIKSQRKQSIFDENEVQGIERSKEQLPAQPPSKSPIAAFTDSPKENLPHASGTTFYDIVSSPDEDVYSSGTPDFFSEIDEEPSSFEDSEYDDSSYTSAESSSSYWEYSDDVQTFSDSER